MTKKLFSKVGGSGAQHTVEQLTGLSAFAEGLRRAGWAIRIRHKLLEDQR